MQQSSSQQRRVVIAPAAKGAQDIEAVLVFAAPHLPKKHSQRRRKDRRCECHIHRSRPCEQSTQTLPQSDDHQNPANALSGISRLNRKLSGGPITSRNTLTPTKDRKIKA